MAAIANVQQQDAPLRRPKLGHDLHPQNIAIESQRCIPIARLERNMVCATARDLSVGGADRHGISFPATIQPHNTSLPSAAQTVLVWYDHSSYNWYDQNIITSP